MTKKTTKRNGERSTINNQRSKIDISHVAKLANLPISEKEEKLFTQQLTKILDYIDQIEKADTKSVSPTYNVSPNKNVAREDLPADCLTQDEALKNAPNSKNGQFVTKGVFES
ncbi:Asp-tRNA(Asn)/Glu-tRNA(Gln) amidotransferase subunit GatC [Candidatus Curtissbacteria bacterium]|nr:Asp-tRNA(Asn)/Glu-tRNA(Gln) amidotransferase subunit GatC [Candidatus Curtissbacteria bacterium]